MKPARLLAAIKFYSRDKGVAGPITQHLAFAVRRAGGQQAPNPVVHDLRLIWFRHRAARLTHQAAAAAMVQENPQP